MNTNTYGGLVEEIIILIDIAITAILAGLFVYFVWKMIDSWVVHAGDETKRAEGKRYAVTAVIVFVVMVSAWGIVNMIQYSLFGW